MRETAAVEPVAPQVFYTAIRWCTAHRLEVAFEAAKLANPEVRFRCWFADAGLFAIDDNGQG